MARCNLLAHAGEGGVELGEVTADRLRPADDGDDPKDPGAYRLAQALEERLERFEMFAQLRELVSERWLSGGAEASPVRVV